MQVNVLESLLADSTASAVSGASAQIMAANPERSALRVQVDPAGTGPVYLLLGSGTASATNFHIALSPTGQTVWDGHIFESLWRGAVQAFGTGARVAIIEA